MEVRVRDSLINIGNTKHSRGALEHSKSSHILRNTDTSFASTALMPVHSDLKAAIFVVQTLLSVLDVRNECERFSWIHK